VPKNTLGLVLHDHASGVAIASTSSARSMRGRLALRLKLFHFSFRHRAIRRRVLVNEDRQALALQASMSLRITPTAASSSPQAVGHADDLEQRRVVAAAELVIGRSRAAPPLASLPRAAAQYFDRLTVTLAQVLVPGSVFIVQSYI
jgi:hypothetical protein